MTPRQPRRAAESTLLSKIDSNKWLIGLVAGGLLNTGIMYQQFAQVKETLVASTAEQKVINSKMTEVQMKQVGGLADINTLKGAVSTLESRTSKIETFFMELPRQRK